MGELVDVLQKAGFTPGAYGIWFCAGMLAIYFIREWRDTRKLSLDDRLARRDGYAKQVADLNTENRALRGDLANLRGEYDNHRKICFQETEQLRNMVIELRDTVEGLRRERGVDAIEILRLKRAVGEQ